jgi:hypothetical protein
MTSFGTTNIDIRMAHTIGAPPIQSKTNAVHGVRTMLETLRLMLYMALT